jgi:hypothetical protein
MVKTQLSQPRQETERPPAEEGPSSLVRAIGTGLLGVALLWFVTNRMWGALFGFGVFPVWDGLRGNSARSSGLGARGKGGGVFHVELRAAFIGLCVSLLLMGFWLTTAGGRINE